MVYLLFPEVSQEKVVLQFCPENMRPKYSKKADGERRRSFIAASTMMASVTTNNASLPISLWPVMRQAMVVVCALLLKGTNRISVIVIYHLLLKIPLLLMFLLMNYPVLR